MSKRSHEECTVELKAKLNRWGFDLNDLSASVARSQTVIPTALEAISNYLENFPTCLIIQNWQTRLCEVLQCRAPSTSLSSAQDVSSSSVTATKDTPSEEPLDHQSHKSAASALSDSRRENPELYKRRFGGPGGSSQTVAKCQRKKPLVDRKESAYERACHLLGKEEVLRLREQWDSMDTKYGGKEFQQGEGMIISLLKQNLSQIVIRAIFLVGGSRVQRLKKVLDDGIETLHTRRQPSQPVHALTHA